MLLENRVSGGVPVYVFSSYMYSFSYKIDFLCKVYRHIKRFSTGIGILDLVRVGQ